MLNNKIINIFRLFFFYFNIFILVNFIWVTMYIQIYHLFSMFRKKFFEYIFFLLFFTYCVKAISCSNIRRKPSKCIVRLFVRKVMVATKSGFPPDGY